MFACSSRINKRNKKLQQIKNLLRDTVGNTPAAVASIKALETSGTNGNTFRQSVFLKR